MRGTMIKKKLRSLTVRTLLSPGYRRFRQRLAEVRRRATFRKHSVQIFLQLDDPYSYLLSHYLQPVASGYKVELRLYLSQALQGEFAPEPAMQAEYALRDCKLLAAELGIPFLDRGDVPVIEHRRALLGLLAEEQGQEDFAESFHEALSCFWRGDTEGAARLVGTLQTDPAETNVLISSNQLLLRKLGHYNSAMMLYAGEWYWGVDRLPHMCDRLDSLGARKLPEPLGSIASLKQAMRLSLPAAVPATGNALPPLDFFFSFRSPYSYLALHRVFAIADAFGVRLRIKPVLPMIMRGMKLPRSKGLYILSDTSREAARHNIEFGKFADPAGDGAKRALAAFFYASSQGKEREYLLAAGGAIWALGVDVGTDEGLRSVTEKAGLFWPDVAAALADSEWQMQAEANREELMGLGIWGVPAYQFSGHAIWGQDRDWLLARLIEDQCHDGDGILV